MVAGAGTNNTPEHPPECCTNYYYLQVAEVTKIREFENDVIISSFTILCFGLLMTLFTDICFCYVMISWNGIPFRGYCISLASTGKHKNLFSFHHRYETNITMCHCLIICQRHPVLQHNTAMWTTTGLSIHMVKSLSCTKSCILKDGKIYHPALTSLRG
jgi:hypothetical protein